MKGHLCKSKDLEEIGDLIQRFLFMGIGWTRANGPLSPLRCSGTKVSIVDRLSSKVEMFYSSNSNSISTVRPVVLFTS
jgi:hypothetical protein